MADTLGPAIGLLVVLLVLGLGLLFLSLYAADLACGYTDSVILC